MLDYTRGSWRVHAPEIDGRIDPNYLRIEAGTGFFTPDNKFYDDTTSGFCITGYLQKSDAVLLANAAKMYELVNLMANAQTGVFVAEVRMQADDLLAEMQEQCNKL